MTLVAGIDVGTGGVRCLILDEQGVQRGFGARAWGDRSTPDGGSELDPADALDAVALAVREALGSCDAAAVAALSITSQRSGVALLDEADEPLYLGTNADGRAFAQGLEQQRAHGDAIYRIAGRGPAILYLPARLAWLRAPRPADAGRVARALALGDWVAFTLTGEAATEATQAAEMLVFDVAAGAWNEDLLAALAVPRGILPPVLAAGEPAGTLRPAAAERLGLRAGVPVVPGGGDTQAAALALGVTEPGQQIVVAGTTMLVEAVAAEPRADPAGRLWLSPHLAAGRWVREAHCGEAGAAVAWVAALLGTDPAGLAREAEQGRPGSGGVAFVDAAPSDVRSFPLIRRAGLTFAAPVLVLGRPRADVARAVFEGLAFAARAGLAWLDERADGGVLAAAGGVTHARVFARALAGASERPVRVASDAASSARGAAILAAAARHGSVAAAARAMRDPGREVAPDPDDGYPAHHAAWLAQAAALDRGTTRLGDLL